ncbi:Elongator complex protein [Lachnellula occidentalis]|uniref:Elongator complex protein 4 n=1 Tax=Lachnellula occidentalis TaxID=215460 RepID=A0A8H8RQF1_9HELO|nr:Elongator complex protein [Lachnellula occidentalis]
MAFRKRGVVLPQAGSTTPSGSSSLPTAAAKEQAKGTRPSPLTGTPTTSTGTSSLDSLFGGHSGLVLGSSLLIEEQGTTDFGGAVLRYYAAEGVVQGHTVHVLGVGEAWGRELPGLNEEKPKKEVAKVDGIGREREERMKIAWRYERLGEFGTSGREKTATTSTFCHTFDLSKRLILPSPSNIHFSPLSTQPDLSFKPTDPSVSPFTKFLTYLERQLASSPPTTIHRIIIPSLLSPALYPSHASCPEHVLQFLHSLRALLRAHPTTTSALITFPLSLFPRSTGLTRWIELLSDSVIELAPFPSSSLQVKAVPGQEEPAQGMLNIHCLMGGVGGGDDLSFVLGRRKGLVVRPYSLPPVDGDQEGQNPGGIEVEGGGKATKADIEF